MAKANEQKQNIGLCSLSELASGDNALGKPLFGGGAFPVCGTRISTPAWLKACVTTGCLGPNVNRQSLHFPVSRDFGNGERFAPDCLLRQISSKTAIFGGFFFFTRKITHDRLPDWDGRTASYAMKWDTAVYAVRRRLQRARKWSSS
jgi:hypothetical protein